MSRRLLSAALLCATLAGCGGGGEARSEAPPPPPAHQGAAAGADLILITLDTLRHDALGFAGNTRVETPALDELAAAGRVYPFAHAHNVVTLPSHANILTGLLPYQHGVRDNAGYVLPSGVPTLATLLAEAGYATGAFVAAFPLDRRFGLDRGFEIYDDEYPRLSSGAGFVLPQRRGDQVVAAAQEWWRSQEGRPRFLWAHLFDPHAPYAPPEPFASRYRDDPYLGEVAAVDSFLAPLLGPHLAGAARPALIVVTSDHGEALGDHGELTHGLFAYEATLRVPLVVWGPGVPSGEDPRHAAHVDIVPTLVELLGIAPPPDLAGRSLLGPAPEAREDDRVVYFDAVSTYLSRGWAPLRGVIRGAIKYIELPLPELYDLEQDPGERQNLVAERRVEVRELREALPREGEWPPDRDPLDGAGAAELRSLGYLAASPARRTSFGPEDDPKNLVAVDRKIHQAIALGSAGRLEEAEAVARQVVAARPGMGMGWEHLAGILQEQGRVPEAVAVLRQGVEAGAAGPSLMRQLGLALAEAGEGAEAVSILEPLIGSGDPETLNALAIAYLESNRLGHAREMAGRVLADEPRDVQALETLGAVALAEGRAEEALGHLDRALEINDELPVAWNSLGVARYQTGDPAGALDAWRRAVELDPSQLDALFNLGLTAAAAGQPARAREALSRFVAAATGPRYAEDRARAQALLARLEGR